MSFQSLEFPLLAALAALCSRYLHPASASLRANVLWPLAFSLLYYCAAAHPLAPPVLLLGVLVTCLAAQALRSGREHRRLIFRLAIGWHILALLLFKYTAFLTGGRLSPPFVPLGISFFTFQQLWLLKEIYSGRFTLGRTEGSGLLLYAFFFPTVSSGPILKPQDFFPQLRGRARRVGGGDLAAALYALSRGYAKKVLLADPLGTVVSNGWLLEDAMTAPAAWVVILGYTLRLYLDFSGYCDIASGCALLLGIRLPVNFDAPYRALSVGEFWKRWHMTLTGFLRECVYFPLGGSRLGMGRTCVNILLVYLVSGLWHGAGWTFLIWGLLHGLMQVLERLLGKWRERLPRWLQWGGTFLFVNVAWVFFQAPSLAAAGGLLRSAVSGGWGLPLSKLASGALDTEANAVRTLLPGLAPYVPGLVLLVLLGGGLAVSLRRCGVVQRMEEFRPTVFNALLSGALLFWAILSFSSTGTFIYSNF